MRPTFSDSFSARRLRRWGFVAALCATAILSACGGDDSDDPPPPGDTTRPTLSIADDAMGTASAPVTFTFTFSEDVGTSFAATDVAVSAGDKGPLVKASATLYTMVVTPPANAAGDLTVTVPAGAFADLAGNTSAAAVSATQAYDTSVELVQMDLPVTFDLATVDYGVVGFGGADDSSIVEDPTDATNTVVKVVRSATAETWAGTTVTAVDDASVQTGFASAIPFDEDNTRMTVRVWSPDAGIVVRVKAEDHTAGGISVETEATTTVASAWETLTFDFADEAASTAVLNLASTYDKVSIFFNFGVAGATAGEKTYYFDDLVFIGGGGTGGGGGEDVPAAAPARPTLPQGDVISLLSDAYTNVPVDTWRTDWSAATLEDVTVGADHVKKYSALDFVGVETVGANLIDASQMTHVHLDVWTPNATTFRIKLVDFGADGAFQGGDDKEHELAFTASSTPALATGQWVSIDLPLSAFTGLTTRAHLAQHIFSALPTAGATTVYLANYYFYRSVSNAPATPPARPSKPQADVISLLSDAYTNVAVNTWRTDWSAATLEDVTVGADHVKKYSALDFVGVETTGPNLVDASQMTHLHLDVWTPDATTFRVKLVDFGADAAAGGGDDKEHELAFTGSTTPALVQGQWVGIDVPLASFTNLTSRTRLAQYIFSALPTANATVYVANVYFYKTGGGGGPTDFATVTFDDAAVTYGMTDFGGNASAVETDPAGGANKVLRVLKGGTAESWAGTTIWTGANDRVGRIPLDAANTRMTVRVWSPDAGIKVRVKVEDAADNTHTVETEATVTTAAGWETLTFDFASPAPGTAPLNPAYTFDRLSIFFNFGVTGATAGAKTYYADDVTFIGGTGGGGGGTEPTAAPAAPTAAAADAVSLFSATYTGTAADFSGRVGSYHASCFGPPGNTVADHTITGTTHTVKKYTFAANSFGIIELIGSTGGTATPPDSALCGGGTQTGANVVNVSGMAKLHLDVFAPEGSGNFQVHLVNADATGTIAGPGAGPGATPGSNVASGANAVAAGTWVHLEIPFSTMGPPTDPSTLTRIGLVKFFTTDAGTYYIDNVYFSK